MAYNTEHGIEPTTIVKEIHDINERLRVGRRDGPSSTRSEREELAGRALTLDNTKAIEKLVTRMETEMRAAAKELEFERAAALRDEIQNIRLRVLEQDASLIVGRAAERAASSRGTGLVGAADRKRGARRDEAAGEHQAFEVMSVTVLPAGEEPVGPLDGDCRDGMMTTATDGDRREHGVGLAAGHPRRARGHRPDRRLARPPDVGSNRDPEHPAKDRNATRRPAPPLTRRLEPPSIRDRTPVRFGSDPVDSQVRCPRISSSSAVPANTT